MLSEEIENAICNVNFVFFQRCDKRSFQLSSQFAVLLGERTAVRKILLYRVVPLYPLKFRNLYLWQYQRMV